MRENYQIILKNAATEVEYAEDCLKDLINTQEASKLWKAWSGLLDHYVKAVSALRRATDTGSSKRWSDQVLFQQKNDLILHYAFQARDQANHTFENSRDAEPHSISIGGAIRLSGNSSVYMSGNRVIGPSGETYNLPDGFIETKDGRYAGGTIPKHQLTQHEPYLVISEARTRSGTYPIPNPDTAPEKRAQEIGEHVLAWLKRLHKEATELASFEISVN